MPEYMITLRKADGTEGVADPRYITFDDATSPETAFAADVWIGNILKVFPMPPRDATGYPHRSGDILFFVHGFNVSHQAAREAHLKVSAQLKTCGWSGLLVSYDWPSDGLVFAYLADRANARLAANTLVTSGIKLLQAAQRVDCRINVHVMAHSMGGFVVQQAFTWAYQDVPPDWGVAQLIFVAADVDSTVFSAGTPSANKFDQHAGRLTAYCSGYDKALMVSNAKRLELEPRVGRAGLPSDAPAFMCEVDCGAFFAATYPKVVDQLSPVTTHCFYFDQPAFYRDLVLTLAGGLSRDVFPTRVDAMPALAGRFDLKVEAIKDDAYALGVARASSSPSIKPPGT